MPLSKVQPEKIFIIAEMACSHEGSPELARSIIDAAGKAGADAIQFQIWSLPDYMSAVHPDYPKLQKLELSASQWTELAEFAKQRFPEMEIIACVSEAKSLALGERLPVSAYKIHAGDIDNLDLLDKVAATKKRIDLSIGACTVEEIEIALGRVGSSPVWLMYGLQRFPTPVAEVHLRHLVELGRFFDRAVGYQDHTAGGDPEGFWIPAAAIGMGITIQEKHITHDRSKKGVDHEAALDPAEFAEFVRMARTLEIAFGQAGVRRLNETQLAYRDYARKSLVALKDLNPGEIMSDESLVALRAHPPGLAPRDLPRVIGKRCERAVPRGVALSPENLS